jgi:hypothetical protein
MWSGEATIVCSAALLAVAAAQAVLRCACPRKAAQAFVLIAGMSPPGANQPIGRLEARKTEDIV